MPGPSSGPTAPKAAPASSSSHAATQVDVSTQVDLLLDSGNSHCKQARGATPLYSREDIIEQYCINNRQINVVTEKSSSGSIFGCLTSRGPSPCSSAAKASILSACVRSAPSDENLFDAAPYPFPAHTRYTMPAGNSWRDRQAHLPIEIMYQQPYSNYPKYLVRYEERRSYDDEDSSYFRRRPKSICTDAKKYSWLPEDEDITRLERPRSVLANYPSHHQPLVSALHSSFNQQHQTGKPKHVSFARSHTLTSFDIPRTKSPPRPPDDVGPINPERLIDSKPTRPGTPNSIAPETPEPRILILEKQPKRGTMKAQATQTEVPTQRGRVPTLSPRTIHRVKMVSQGAQTNGILNGRKLHKSYSEAGQLGTPLGGPTANKDEQHDHEPLQRTQSEEPPKSPYLLEDVPSPRNRLQQNLTNGDAESHEIQGTKRKDSDPDDKEILIDFKPAPVSPDARSLLNEMANPYRRYVSLQKTLSDGEIQVERRELIGETGEPSYPHSCRRNHPDSWAGRLRQPVQFSSTPDDLSLLRISPPDDHNDEEFHENLVRRGLFRKRSVSLEDGVQVLSASEYILPRSLPTSPTSPTSAAAPPRRIHHHDGRGVTRTVQYLYANQHGSPFASSDSLANDLTRDGSDGIWNESQATVLQADSIALLTPSSRRRHLLMLQHQQRSSMDTDALDAEDEMEPVYSSTCSPRIRLEAATPVTSSHSIEPSYVNTNGQRQRLSYLRRSPAPPLSQPHSQSSSDFGLSRSGTTDISETSTTDEYVTANTSAGTGTTTGGTNSSHSRQPYKLTGPSATASTTATVADGSSFESASSVYSLARSEAMLDESVSPRISKDKSDSAYSVQHQQTPPKSTSSSSSGSYDLEDANPESPPRQQELQKITTSVQPGILTKQEVEVSANVTLCQRREKNIGKYTFPVPQ
ncbi:hypothetical protein QAD02_023157 [Eretmocerus hayati]|uniref:Uncharacterized protein n=1 Tax=Eretmocerus hayati TaxID=131215 RepID=A0ACC2PW56_9HYME|nr:hypothetical protein QAD02_023157 [Eretmocerus hayati]